MTTNEVFTDQSGEQYRLVVEADGTEQVEWVDDDRSATFELGGSAGGMGLFIYSDGAMVGGGGVALIERTLMGYGYTEADARNLTSRALQAPRGQRVTFTVTL